jgi:fructose 1,6-bisphosphatase
MNISRKIQRSLHRMTVEEIVEEAIVRERELKSFFDCASTEVGPDARLLMVRMLGRHDEEISELKSLLDEIRELRELSAGIAD